MIWNITVFWLNFQKVRHDRSGTKKFWKILIRWPIRSEFTSAVEQAYMSQIISLLVDQIIQMMVLVNPPDLLIEIRVWPNYNQVHKIFFSKDLEFISISSRKGTVFSGQCLKWTVLYQSGRSRVKMNSQLGLDYQGVDGLNDVKWTVMY